MLQYSDYEDDDDDEDVDDDDSSRKRDSDQSSFAYEGVTSDDEQLQFGKLE